MRTGETLRLLRMLKGLKQSTLAHQLGISQPAYSKIEKCNRINEVRWNNILTILNCTDSELENLKSIISPKDMQPPVN